MRNISIRKKVSLYYSIVLISVSLLIFTVFAATVDIQTNSVSKKTLTNAVQNGFDEIECDNGVIEIDNDFDAYSKGVTLIVYGSDGSVILGKAPSTFPSSTPLTNGYIHEIKGEADNWIAYDLYNSYPNGTSIWIRGIYALDSGNEAVKSIMLIMLIVLPVILLIAIIAGRRITNKAFNPIREIISSAESINTGNDLSKRITVQNNKDELYYLSETLNAMMDRLENAFISEKQFSSDVSHELKTPISVILAECEYTLKENGDVTQYKEAIESIEKQCKRTMSLISQLLQLSHTINKENAIQKEVFNLSILCTSIAEELSISAKEKNILLYSDIEEDLNYLGDETLILRMIINLVNNAIKYGIDGGFVKLSLRRTLEGKILITVSDNGIGISKIDRKNIFNRFYKADKSRFSDNNSFGLGLSMVKWIVEAHDGFISVESEINIGSTFTVML